jgi:hypothetical protein
VSTFRGEVQIESPLNQEIAAEAYRGGYLKALVVILEGRFGPLTPTVRAGLQQMKEDKGLARLARHAALCPTLQAFEEQLGKDRRSNQGPQTPPA